MGRIMPMGTNGHYEIHGDWDNDMFLRPENPWVWLIQLTKDTTHWNEAVLDRSYECSRATS